MTLKTLNRGHNRAPNETPGLRESWQPAHGDRRASRADIPRIAVTIAIIFAVAASVVLLAGFAFSGRIIALSAELVAIAALLAAAGGLYAWMQARARLIELNAQTARLKHANLALRKSQARYRSLVDAQDAVIFRRTADGRLSFVNQVYCNWFGRDPEKSIGRRHRLAKLSGPARPKLKALIKPPHTACYQQRMRTAQGIRWIAWEDRAIFDDDNNLIEVQTIGRDVTDAKQAEREIAKARDLAVSANRAKSMFLATMSHEIRTPMNGVLGMADLLCDTKLTAAQQNYVDAIGKSGRALLSLIDDILDFSKIEAGRFELDRKPFDLGGLIEDAAELLGPRAMDKGLDLACFVDPEIKGDLIGDPERLRQVLLNIAGNALKFTEAGHVLITVAPAYRNARARGGKVPVTITISDTGIGIAPADMRTVFDDFRQADATPARKYGGTGLGLAISKRLVEMMGGKLNVETEPGKGARFYFTIPLGAQASAPARPAQAGAARGSRHLTGNSFQNKRLMVIAPGGATRTALARYLRSFGADVKTMRTQRQARAALDRMQKSGKAVEAVFLDHGSGPDGGGAFLEIVKEHVAQGAYPAPPKIIALTAPVGQAALTALKAAGFDGYLIKPVRRKTLAERFAIIAQSAPAPARDIWRLRNQPPQSPELAQLPRLRVLLAEDNDINALLTLSLLERGMHKTIRVANGDDAVDMATRHHDGKARAFDLVLMDVHMPGRDGLAAARAIRDAEARAGLPPDQAVVIIALTASAFVDDRKKCLAAGMDDYLVKPVDADAFNRTILTHLQDRKSPHKGTPAGGDFGRAGGPRAG